MKLVKFKFINPLFMRKNYFHKPLGLLAAILTVGQLFAQPSPAPEDEFLPKDYLPPSFHAGRRAALREIMPPNSVMVVFAFPTRTFSNDVSYIYHQNPDLYYFTGYKEPHSMLLVFSSPQADRGCR